MIPLDYAGTRALSLITAQNGADVAVSFSDFDTTTEDYARGVPTLTTIASATTTAICATPASGKIRDVEFVNIKNTYAGSHTMTLQITSGSGGPFVIKTFILLSGESVNYAHGIGFQFFDASGSIKTVIGGAVAATTLSASGAVTLASTLSVTGATTLAALSATTGAFSSTLRVQGSAAPASGSGVEMLYTGGNGYFQAINRDTTTFLPMFVQGSSISLNPNGSTGFILDTTLAGLGTGYVKVDNAGKLFWSAT